MLYRYSIVVREKFNHSNYFTEDFLTEAEVKEVVRKYEKGHTIRIRDLETFKDVSKKFLTKGEK